MGTSDKLELLDAVNTMRTVRLQFRISSGVLLWLCLFLLAVVSSFSLEGTLANTPNV